MKSKNILIREYENFDYGFTETCRAVFQTYASEGKLAYIQRGDDQGFYSKDGVSVAQAIRFDNLTASAGAISAIVGASRTLSLSQDSTTLTCILMHAFVTKMKRKDFTKKVEAGVYEAVNEVYHHLYKLSRKASKKDLKQIAKVASNGDEYLSNLLVDAFNYCEANGFVDIIMDKDLEKSVFEKQEGLLLKNHGFTSEYFSNRADKKIAFEGENVGVICASVWDYNQEIVNKIQQFYQGKPRETPLIVFIERSSSDFTEKLIGIKKVGFNVCVVACNGYSEHASETLLNDIATYTGSSVYDPRNPDSEIIFGLADKIVSNIESTSILNLEQTKEFKELVSLLSNAEKKDEARIKMLTTKASVIRIGGLTPLDIKESFDRAEDALGSLKSSTVEGIIPGGGSTLAYISGLMKTNLNHPEKQKGYELTKWVLQQPIIRLLKNANRDQPKWYEFWKPNYVKSAQKEFGVGYNSSLDEISNLEKDGIIDSKKSIRVAIESSVEQSIKVLNLGVIIHDPTERTLESH